MLRIHSLPTRQMLGRAVFALILSMYGCGDGKSPTSIVSGTASYEDREYDQSGFTGRIRSKPIRFADVEVVRAADGAVLASTATDSGGAFSLTFVNSAGPGVYVRVLSRTASSLVNIAVSDTTGVLYAATGTTFNERAASSPIAVTAPVITPNNDAVGGAFHIMDVFTDGSEFIRNLSGRVPPLVTALWEIGAAGTYYDSDLDQISVMGGSGIKTGDHDEYDDAVLLHEYGHHIAKYYSRDDSPGGVHFLDENTQDIRLAWSEGWATFFAGAVLGSPSYVDTVGGDPPTNSASAFDLETRATGSPLTYTTSEGAVATVLWDIFDQSTGEAFDGIGDSMAAIWDSFANALTSASAVSMEDFWDGWFGRAHGLATEMRNVTADRQMGFSEDPSGANNVAGCTTPLALDSPLNETLYSTTTDVDYLCVTLTAGTSYTIETTNLANGADTFIEVFDDQMTVIASNDNRTGAPDYSQCPTPGEPCNNGTALASRVMLTPSAPGMYVVKITRSANAPPSAGTYGSYTLTLRLTSS